MFIYFLYYEDRVIYIGSTKDFKQRMFHHKSDLKRGRKLKLYDFMRDKKLSFEDLKAYKFETNLETKFELTYLEGIYIRLFKPICNVVINGRNWREYYEEKREEKLKYNHEYYENNKEKILEQQREYEKKNKEKIKLHKKEYYENNKENFKEKSILYREKNKEEIMKRKKKYREKNKEILKIKNQKYIQDNKEKVLKNNRNAKKKYRNKNREQINEKKRERDRQNKTINCIRYLFK